MQRSLLHSKYSYFGEDQEEFYCFVESFGSSTESDSWNKLYFTVKELKFAKNYFQYSQMMICTKV